MIESRAGELLPLHAELIEDLELKAGLDRTIENLPAKEEIAERINTGKGLTRPEIGILNSYEKIRLTKDIIGTEIPDREEVIDEWLVNYFPEPIRKKYRAEIMGHRLKREIIATTVANSVVNRMGPGFIKMQQDRTGATFDEVVRAFLITKGVFQLKSLWDSIEALDNKVPAIIQLRVMQAVRDMVEREATWFLTRLGRPLNIAADTKLFRAGVEELCKNTGKAFTPEMAADMDHHTQMGVRDGLPENLARFVAQLPMLGASGDIIRISTEQKAGIPITASIYLEVGELLHISWLTKQAGYIAAEDRWTEEARDSLIEQLYICQAGLTAHILKEMKPQLPKTSSGKEKLESVVQAWLRKHESHVTQAYALFEEMRRAGSVDIPMLLIAEQRLRHLYGG
jgi:glutamate dehydrogenase